MIWASHPIAIDPEGDKITRMSVQSARIEAGLVLIPGSASRLGEFQREILSFPTAGMTIRVEQPNINRR